MAMLEVEGSTTRSWYSIRQPRRRDSLYRPGDRGWVKVKNRAYWRFHDERQLAQARRRTRLTI
jgi:hypothetical protein